MIAVSVPTLRLFQAHSDSRYLSFWLNRQHLVELMIASRAVLSFTTTAHCHPARFSVIFDSCLCGQEMCVALISAPLTVVLRFGRMEARPSTGNLLPSPVQNDLHCGLFDSYLKGKAPSPK